MSPVIECYGYTWLQHPEGLYYGPPYPGTDDTLLFSRGQGRVEIVDPGGA